MNLQLHIPEPVVYIAGTIIALIVIRVVASLIYPSN